MITIPSLNDVTDIADSDVVMITNSQGESFKLAGSEINKRGKIIIASSTTVTGAPLKTGSSVRIYFTADLTAANASTTLQLNYNGVNYYVKAPKNGALVNFVATNLGGTPTVFKYLQAYTTLELLFDGTQFVIIGNPVILSSADYTIYADGAKAQRMLSTNRTATTSQGGTVGTPLNFTDDAIIGIDVTSAYNIAAIPFVYDNNIYQIYFFDWGTKQPIVNTSVTYTIYYYKK